MRRFTLYVAFVGLALLLLPAAVVWSGGARSGAPVPGDPLPGLTTDQQAAFSDGLDEFSTVEHAPDGLGPAFNGKSCAECHAIPAVGGSSFDLLISREIRIATVTNGIFDPLVRLGGPVLQQRSIQEEVPDCPIVGETVPPEATLVSHRITTPLFGDGLIEAIPASQILQAADPFDRNGDGISGVPNRVYNPETGQTELGRFGWKAHASTLHVFSGDAYLNEMGVTSPTFPAEMLPQGQPIPPEFDAKADPEDDGTDVGKFATFMRFVAPLSAAPLTSQAQQGFRVFKGIGCAGCHTPTLTTGDNPVAALRFQPVHLFSDLLLHDMGPGLADGMEMGTAKGFEWRTAPLWGLGRRKFFLHDGRATTIAAAVAAHGGEARRCRDRAAALSLDDRNAVLAFLRSL